MTRQNHSIQLNQYQPSISYQTDITQQNKIQQPKQQITTDES
jgi:hypothetical protein